MPLIRSHSSQASPPSDIPPCPVCGSVAVPEPRFGSAALARCGGCGFTFLHTPADGDLYHDAYFETYVGGDYLQHEARRRHESRRRLDLLARVVPPPATLLEVGSAAGFFLDEARRRGYDGVGIEPNEAMSAHGREVLGVDIRTGVLGEVPIESSSFDAVCAFHVVEHLDDPLGALRGMHDALRPGGHVVIEVPNAESAAARRHGARWAPLDLPHHVGQYGARSLRTLLARAGFEVLRVDSVPFALYGASTRLGLLLRGLAEGLRSGTLLPAAVHPTDHQLLRAVGRRGP